MSKIKMRRQIWYRRAGTTAIYAVLIVVALAILAPFYWMVITTVRPAEEVYKVGLHLIPSSISLAMYRDIIGDPFFKIPRYFLNSVLIAVGATTVNLVVSFLGAYGLTRTKVLGGKAIYYLILAQIMMPAQVILIGIFVIVGSLGLRNTYPGIILPISCNAVVFLIIYNFVASLPREVKEAALVDGASELQVLRYIVAPLSLPALRSGGLLMFLYSWQAFIIPYLLSTTDKFYTLPVAMRFFENKLFATMQEVLTIGVIITIPSLLVFILTQRTVMKGIVAGSVKY